MLSFIGQTYCAVCTARFKKEQMVGELSRLEACSCKLEGDLASLRVLGRDWSLLPRSKGSRGMR